MSSSNPTRLRILERIADGVVSGPTLAEDCGITRAAVWKQVEELRERGFEIESTSEGYRLESVPEYGGLAIALGLQAPYEILYRDSVDSTNEVARTKAVEGATNLAVLADQQTAGRGRLGRSWRGPSGGIYLSILLRPDVPPMDVPLMTLAAAVATAEALEVEGFEPGIKWPNDLLIGDRKVAGILTEMEGEADRVSWVIVGIGVNANVAPTDLPEEATSLRTVKGSSVRRRDIVQSLLARFDKYRSSPDRILPAWRERSHTLGERVRVRTAEDEVVGLAQDVVHPGSLEIETAQGTVAVHAGDCEHLSTD